MAEEQEVWIFYSGEERTEIHKMYSEGIAYLYETEIKTHIINVNERPELAEKYKVIATPILLIKKEGAMHKYIGIVEGLKQILIRDLFGKSILHLLSFKEGRALAKKLKLPKKKKEIEAVLRENLRPRGIYNFRLTEFNTLKKHAKVSLKSGIPDEQGKSKTPVCVEISTFLSGIFTEIFKKGVDFKETHCMAQGHSYCEFEIKKPRMPEKIEMEISEKIKKWE